MTFYLEYTFTWLMKVMVNFQLGKLNVKDEMINDNTSVGQRKTPTGIEPMTSRTPGGCSIHWAMRTYGEQAI